MQHSEPHWMSWPAGFRSSFIAAKHQGHHPHLFCEPAKQWGINFFSQDQFLLTLQASCTVKYKDYCRFGFMIFFFLNCAEHALLAKSTSFTVMLKRQHGPIFLCFIFPLPAWTHLVMVLTRSTQNTHKHTHPKQMRAPGCTDFQNVFQFFLFLPGIFKLKCDG